MKLAKHLWLSTLSIISLNLSAETLVLDKVNLIDVKQLKTLPSQTLLIENGKISNIVASKKYRKKRDHRVIDLAGKFVIPGLIDAHVHHATDPDGWDNAEVTALRLKKLLRGGVTSVRDMGGDSRVLAYLKRQAELDAIPSPDIYFSVIIGGPEFFKDKRTVSSAKGHTPGNTVWMRSVTAETDLESAVLQAKGLGATGIKIYAKVPANLLPELTKAAKKHGLKVWSHAFVGPARPSDAINAGVETISHVPDLAAEVIDNYYGWRRADEDVDEAQKQRSLLAESYDDLLQLMLQKGTILDATLTVFEERQQRSKNSPVMYQHAKMLTGLAHQKGVKIAAGTDAFSDASAKDYPMVNYEMQLLVRDAGLTPLEALQAGTLHNAEVIGVESTTGSIEVGKVANLVVLNADPEMAVENMRDIQHVIKNGQFVYRGNDPRLPFSSARRVGAELMLSGQLGNLPSTMTLASDTIEGQMKQAMENIGDILDDNGLGFDHVRKCTVMLADIKDWPKANAVYTQYFTGELPARSAFATAGLALEAKVEIECIAAF